MKGEQYLLNDATGHLLVVSTTKQRVSEKAQTLSLLGIPSTKWLL
jgi:hypothetical protein